MTADEFLKRNHTALLAGDLQQHPVLCHAIAGVNRNACSLGEPLWTEALKTASTDWLLQWPGWVQNGLSQNAHQFFAGPQHPVADVAYSAYRLQSLKRVIPDSTAPPDIQTQNLPAQVYQAFCKRELIFVTDWQGFSKPDCCVADCVDMLGLADHQIPIGEERIAVELSIRGTLYKPTWIDSGFWLYWMPNLANDEAWGFARNLATGGVGAKEWVCRPTDVTVVSARPIRASRAVDSRLDKLSEAYWQACRAWVVAYRQLLAERSLPP